MKDSERLRKALCYLGRQTDGEPAAANVHARRRSVLFNFLEYAISRRHLPANPLLFRHWDG